MVEFLVKHKLINTSQHGFLKARSCLGKGKVKSSPRHYALGSHEGLYGQCLNLVSVVQSKHCLEGTCDGLVSRPGESG